MIRKAKKSRKYFAPSVKVTHLALESNFCDTMRFNVQVQELDNINKKIQAEEVSEPTYFEF